MLRRRHPRGDESQLMLWVSGMLVCALGAGLMLRRKKEN